MTCGVDLGVDSPLKSTIDTFMVPCYLTDLISIPPNRALELREFLPCPDGLLRMPFTACSLLMLIGLSTFRNQNLAERRVYCLATPTQGV